MFDHSAIGQTGEMQVISQVSEAAIRDPIWNNLALLGTAAAQEAEFCQGFNQRLRGPRLRARGPRLLDISPLRGFIQKPQCVTQAQPQFTRPASGPELLAEEVIQRVFSASFME